MRSTTPICWRFQVENCRISAGCLGLFRQYLGYSAYFSEVDEGRRDLYKGMRKALYLRVGFWDWMHARALECPPAGARP